MFVFLVANSMIQDWWKMWSELAKIGSIDCLVSHASPKHNRRRLLSSSSQTCSSTNSVPNWIRWVVVQNESDSQVLALSEPRLRFHPEYETRVVMMLQRLDKVKRTKRVLAFSLNRTDIDVHDLAWWSD